MATCLCHIGHSLLTSQQLFADEAATFVSYTLSVAVSQQHCQSLYLSQLLHTVSVVADKYNTVRSVNFIENRNTILSSMVYNVCRLSNTVTITLSWLRITHCMFNPLKFRGNNNNNNNNITIYKAHNVRKNWIWGAGRNYSATSNNMKLVHWPLMGGLLHLVQQEGDWADRSAPRPLLAVPNVAHPLTGSGPTTILLCNGPLLCGFNVAICWYVDIKK